MRRELLALGMLIAAVTLVCHGTFATPFDPLFRVSRISGTCAVLLPGAASTVPVEDGKAYPFGTDVVTADGATCVVVLSLGNECALGPNTRVTVTDGIRDKKLRVLSLPKGHIEVSLEEGFEAANALDVVTHCSTLSALKGGTFFADVKSEEDLHAVVFGSGGAEVRVTGPQYEIATLQRDQTISVACSTDRSFIRLKDVSGNYTVAVRKDAAGSQELVQMVPGSVVKIHQKVSDVDGALMVTVLVIGSDGSTVEQAFTYSTRPGEAPGAVVPSTTQPAPVPEEAKAEVGEEWPPMWSSTATTSTTTTTYPPPEGEFAPTPTPVGRT